MWLFGRQTHHTKLHMLLWTGKQLPYSCHHSFVGNEELASKKVLSDEIHEDLDKVAIKRDFVEAEASNFWVISSLVLQRPNHMIFVLPVSRSSRSLSGLNSFFAPFS